MKTAVLKWNKQEIQKDCEKKGKKGLLWLIGLGSSVSAAKAAVVGLLAMGTVAAGGIGYFGVPVFHSLISPSTVSKKAATENPFASQNAARQQELQDASGAKTGSVSHLQTYKEGFIPAFEGDFNQGREPSGEKVAEAPPATVKQAQELTLKGGFEPGERISGAGEFTGTGPMEAPSTVSMAVPVGSRGNIQVMRSGMTGRVVQGGSRAVGNRRGDGSIGVLKLAARTSQMAARMSNPEAAHRTAYDAMAPAAGAGNVEEIGKGLQGEGGAGLTQSGAGKVSASVKDIRPVASGAAESDPRPWEKDVSRARKLLFAGIAFLTIAIGAALISKLFFGMFHAKATAAASAGTALAGSFQSAAASIQASASAASASVYGSEEGAAASAAAAAMTAAAGQVSALTAKLNAALANAKAATKAGPEIAAAANITLETTLASFAAGLKAAMVSASSASAASVIAKPFVAFLGGKTASAAGTAASGTVSYSNAMSAWKVSRTSAAYAALAGAAVAATGVMINSNYDQGPTGHMWTKSGTALTGMAATYWFMSSAGPVGMITGVLTLDSLALSALLAGAGGYLAGGGLGAIGGRGYKP